MKDERRPDAELLAATVRGDEAAFAGLVRRYIRAASLLAAQLLGDRDEAEDIVQDAFTVVHQKASRYDPQRPFGPWFFAIVRRLAGNRRSRDVRRERLLRLWGRGWSTRPVPVSPSAEAAVFAGMDAEAARRAMNDLSPMQRACFELVAVRDLSPAEVAEMHGISESTVRQHVFRARAVLRGVLDGNRDVTGSHG